MLCQRQDIGRMKSVDMLNSTQITIGARMCMTKNNGSENGVSVSGYLAEGW